MAPSTVTPTHLHRAPVACVSCRTAKVRCLVSQDPRRCDRCIAQNYECVFVRPRRQRGRGATPSVNASSSEETGRAAAPSSATRDARRSTPGTGRAATENGTPAHAASSVNRQSVALDNGAFEAEAYGQPPVITNEIRSRIVTALSSLEGRKGPAFSFVTSGDTPSTVLNASGVHDNDLRPHEAPSSNGEPSLRLSSILRPLNGSPEAFSGAGGRENGETSLLQVRMPSYVDSMTLGHVVADPVAAGIIGTEASTALFAHFMEHMNAKWEYILDPYVDVHDNVRARSHLLFATVLFCSSKFAKRSNGCVVPQTDPFLQTRLCSVARNLAVRSFAQGDRSIETMQAFYLLACWKEPEDDISYLHSGYAFRTLQDLCLEQGSDGRDTELRRKRTWLALFRQDKQQNLFFMRDSRTTHTDDSALRAISDPRAWRAVSHGLPADLTACCNADLRRIQGRMHELVRKASPPMLPCLLDLLESELCKWKTTWQDATDEGWEPRPGADANVDPRLLHPGKAHIQSLIGLWESSVRLNVSSAIFRQELTAAVASAVQPSNRQQQHLHQHQQQHQQEYQYHQHQQQHQQEQQQQQQQEEQQPLPQILPPQFSATQLDLPVVTRALATDMVGLRSSIEGAFGTLQQLLVIPSADLRRSPDSVLLLGPMTALFLCLVLCLPRNGIIGPSFQEKAVSLIFDVANHYQSVVVSAQDSAVMHADYLQSLVELLKPRPSDATSAAMNDTIDLSGSMVQQQTFEDGLDCSTLQAAQLLAGRMNVRGDDWMHSDNGVMGILDDPTRALDLQSLENLLEPGYF